MASKLPVRLGVIAAFVAGLLSACGQLQPVSSGNSGLLTGPGGAADGATGGQGNDAHGDNHP